MFIVYSKHQSRRIKDEETETYWGAPKSGALFFNDISRAKQCAEHMAGKFPDEEVVISKITDLYLAQSTNPKHRVVNSNDEIIPA